MARGPSYFSGEDLSFFNRLLRACWEIPSMPAAMDWFPSARFMASRTRISVACLIVGSSGPAKTINGDFLDASGGCFVRPVFSGSPLPMCDRNVCMERTPAGFAAACYSNYWAIRRARDNNAWTLFLWRLSMVELDFDNIVLFAYHAHNHQDAGFNILPKE